VDKRAKQLGRKVLQVYQAVDPEVDRRVAELPVPVRCTKGCSGCCHLLTMVTLPEAIAIAEHVLPSPPMLALEVEGYVARVHAIMDRFRDRPLNAQTWFESAIPCLFLTASRQCRVYPVRPAPCRYHYVVSDPARCDPPNDREVHKVDTRQAVLVVLSEVARMSRRESVDLYIAPLPIMFLWAIKFLVEGREAFDTALERTDLGWLDLHWWAQWAEENAPSDFVREDVPAC